MASMKIMQLENVEYLSAAEFATDELRAKVGDREIDGTKMRFLFGDVAGTPQLVEIDIEPDVEASAHAHESDEIIFVLEGELRFGRQVCSAGTGVFIPGNTLYGFRTGPAGVRFLNFRPSADFSYISKDEFMDRRGERAPT